MTAAHPDRIPALDGLRGIAILMVMFCHTFRLPGIEMADTIRISEFFASWHIGVDLFFVISGFLITGILMKHSSSPEYYRRFYWRRFLRIVPLYAAFLLIVAIFQPYPFDSRNAWWYATFTSNIYLTINGFDTIFLTPLWSLALEEQFYFVWPFIVRHSKKITLVVVMLILLLSQPLMRYLMPVGIYTNPLTRLDGLLIGALVALNLDSLKLLVTKYSRAFAWMLGLSLAWLLIRACIPGLRYDSLSVLFKTMDFSIVSICFGIALLATVTTSSSKLHSLLTKPVLISFGIYSYSLFLFHTLIAHYVTQAGLIPSQFEGVAASAMCLLWSLGVIAISWLFARLTWKYFESPILRLKDRKRAQPSLAY